MQKIKEATTGDSYQYVSPERTINEEMLERMRGYLANYRLDTLIWDVDGTLVNVSSSQSEAIRQTASYYLGREVTKEEVDLVKAMPNMNNDWDTTYALMKESGVPYDEMKATYQAMYLGTADSPGLIATEQLHIPREDLVRIQARYGPMGIVTGRPRAELEMALDQFQLRDIFRTTVSLEDAEPKPKPDPILLAMQRMNSVHPVYIGDGSSDRDASTAAGVLFLGIRNEPPGIYVPDNRIYVPNPLDVVRLLV